MSPIKELQHALEVARKRSDQATRDVSAGILDLHSQEYDDVLCRVLDLERQLAAAKGEPHAMPFDFPVRWDVGAPLPHLFANDYQALL